MNQNQLVNYQADKIEMALWAHHIYGCHVEGGLILPRFTRHFISLPPGVRPEAISNLSRALAHQLGVSDLRISQDDHGRVVVDIPRADARPVSLLAVAGMLPRSLPRHTAILGLDHDAGQPLLLSLPSPDVAHVLVAGHTGSGKTELAKTIAASLAMYNRPWELQIILIDPKYHRFQPLSHLPHLLTGRVIADLHDSLAILRRMVVLMEDRGQDGVADPRLVLVIDELADLVVQGGDQFRQDLERLLQRGREAGIHVVACTQKPTVDAIGSLVKGNFPVRLVGAVANAEDAKIASGLPATGAEKLRGRGDFLLAWQGQVTRFQAALLTQPLLDRIAACRPRSGPVLELPSPLAGGSRRGVEDRLSPLLRLLPGGLHRDYQDAQRIAEDGGFVARYWDPARGELAYGYQTALAHHLGVENVGNHRGRILRVAALIVEILKTSNTSNVAGPSHSADFPGA